MFGFSLLWLVYLVYTKAQCTTDESNEIDAALTNYETCITTPPFTIANYCSKCIPNYARDLSTISCVDDLGFEAASLTCEALGCGSDCSDLSCKYPPAGSCSFYQSCVENVTTCGPNGYALGFGYKYCEAFLSEEGTFSPTGYQWSQYVRPCLQQSLGSMDIAHMSCDEISSAAIDSHLACYNERQQGDLTPTFCQLSWSDRLKIMWVIKGVFLTSRWWAISKQGAQIMLWDCPVRGVTSVLVHLDTDIGTFASWSDQAISSWTSDLEGRVASSLLETLAPGLSDDWTKYVTVGGFSSGSLVVNLALNFNTTDLPWNGSLTVEDATVALQNNLLEGKINTTWNVTSATIYQTPPPSSTAANSASASSPSLWHYTAVIILILLAITLK